jgi:CBS domain-containing protein
MDLPRGLLAVGRGFYVAVVFLPVSVVPSWGSDRLKVRVMMVAREIMTPGAECIGADESVQQAAEKMTELGVGALPICGTDERLKGVLTDRDIVVKVLGKSKDPAKTPAGSLAQKEAVTIGADDDAEAILHTMAEHKVRRLPVIDGHRLVGMVSSGDVAQALPHPNVGELLATLTT